MVQAELLKLQEMLPSFELVEQGFVTDPVGRQRYRLAYRFTHEQPGPQVRIRQEQWYVSEGHRVLILTVTASETEIEQLRETIDQIVHGSDLARM